MKIRIIKDHDHRLSEGRVLAFKAGTEEDRPAEMCRTLIAAGVAIKPKETNQKEA